MDIFDVLKEVSKRKLELVRIGMKESEALNKAELYVSKEYHILLNDIKKLYRSEYKSEYRSEYRSDYANFAL